MRLRNGIGIVVVLAAAVAAAAPALALHVGARHPTVEHSSERLGDWRLDIARDRFAARIACRLEERDHRAIYIAGAVGFRFDHRWDVSGAVYRLDDGAPRQARDDLPALIALGVPVDSGAPQNASEGIVWVPYPRLAAAKSIAIQARRDRAARVFRFEGLQGLHDRAVTQGCAPDRVFVTR